jgi:predicted component of type VI protein secretion system
MQNEKLSTLQLELLNAYSFQPDEKDILAIRKFLAEYFSDKLIQRVENAVKERKISEADLDRWLNE